MVTSLILEAFAPLVEAYRKIEELQAQLERTGPDCLLYKISSISLVEAEKEFEYLFDREIDGRVQEILDNAKRELDGDMRKRAAQQAHFAPQLLPAHS